MTTFHERRAAAAEEFWWEPKDGMVELRPEVLAHIAACPPEMVQAWENVVKAARELRFDVMSNRKLLALADALAAYDAQVDHATAERRQL